MSFQALAWAVKQKVGNGTRKAVLLCIANYADDKGQCYPSQQLISEEAEVSERSVFTIVKEFEGQGLLHRIARRRSDGTRTSDLITLAIPQPATVAVRNPINPQKAPRATRNHCDAEPITEPITLRGKNGSGKKKIDGARWEKLASLIDVPKEPRRRAS